MVPPNQTLCGVYVRNNMIQWVSQYLTCPAMRVFKQSFKTFLILFLVNIYGNNAH